MGKFDQKQKKKIQKNVEKYIDAHDADDIPPCIINAASDDEDENNKSVVY